MTGDDGQWRTVTDVEVVRFWRGFVSLSAIVQRVWAVIGNFGKPLTGVRMLQLVLVVPAASLDPGLTVEIRLSSASDACNVPVFVLINLADGRLQSQP